MSKFQMQFSHVGLYVKDVNKLARFYTEVMGFTITDRGVLNGNDIVFLSRDPMEHHQIVLVAGGNSDDSTKLLNQISFRLESLKQLIAFVKSLEGKEVSRFEPVIHGTSWSLYFRDPEGHRIEVFVDSDWYIPQPVKEYLDFNLTEDEILRQSYDFCKAQPGFEPMANWREKIRLLIQKDAVQAAGD